jgi:hypothetical protein
MESQVRVSPKERPNPGKVLRRLALALKMSLLSDQFL